jgi:hypothetical protein
LASGKITYTDISSTDPTFNDYTSLSDHNSTLNFFVGFAANVDLNDNEYVRIRAYSYSERMEMIYNSSYKMGKCSK